jgi:hypothetical protein
LPARLMQAKEAKVALQRLIKQTFAPKPDE